MQVDLFGNQEQPKAFYNTSKLRGEVLTEAEVTAKEQTERIYLIFKRYRMLSPSQAWEHYKRMYPKDKNILLTSVRRSITNMTQPPTAYSEAAKAAFVSKLIKTNVQVNGPFGERSKEFVWKINEEYNETEPTHRDTQN